MSQLMLFYDIVGRLIANLNHVRQASREWKMKSRGIGSKVKGKE